MSLNFNFPLLRLCLVLCLLATACEQKVSLYDPDYEPQLMIVAELRTDSLPEIFVTETQAIRGWIEQIREAQFVRGLEPQLYHDSTVHTFTEKSRLQANQVFYSFSDPNSLDSSLVYYYQGTEKLTEGKYAFSLVWQGDSLHAETTIPSPVQIDTVYNESRVFEPGPNQWIDRFLRIRFQDPPGTADYYRIRYGYSGWERDFYRDSTGQYVSDSIPVEGTGFSRTYSDQGFDGREMVIDFSPYARMLPHGSELIDGENIPYRNIWIRIERLSTELGVFWTSLLDQNYANGDPFVEPVTIKSNIEGGVGVFGGMQSSDTLWTRYFRN